VTTERRVLIADDEPLARERLHSLLARHEGYRVVSECADGDETLEAIERDRPDLAFLDISMPGRSGVEVAQELLHSSNPPAIVFVTAHDEFALQAFEVSAVDYLVKPVDRERFDQTLGRIEHRFGDATAAPRDDALRALLKDLLPGPARRKRFVIRSTRGHYFVRTEDVETAVADGNYIALSAGGRAHLVRETMKTFEASLDPAQFVRIHRSTIINIDRIARIEPLGHGEYRVTMQSGSRFESSRAYSERLHALLR
jgi:two-component system LytT family response regulator